jgi:UDP-glucose 4-epimerase
VSEPSAVLITGATTPLGAALCKSLTRDGHRVLAVGIEDGPGAWLENSDERLTYERADLTRERSVRKLLFGTARAMGVEAVVHTATHRSIVDEGSRVHKINVGATRTLLRLCERLSTLKRFVYRSDAEVYRHDFGQPSLMAEDHPLELSSGAPQRVRDRVAADLTVCTRMGMSRMNIAVLRMAEVLAPSSGSQLWDWLQSENCMRPLGFNPMVNVLSVEDAVRALRSALDSDAVGVFNIPGKDTLPLKVLVRRWGRRDVPVPGPMLSPLYRLRRRVRHTEFKYSANRGRLHTSDLVDGTRAGDILGYEPARSIDWPG